ncbi:phosphomannomutase/phosphoglucomutase [Candidatus Dojkabacteria bacterium]|nr:phosphomannomutase/phosphoglucomutase [Candidatus Dojkabacteria bacterium]
MQKFDKKILDNVFHAYDVRGKVPEELDEEFFEALGKAFVKYLNAKKIAVGRDIRETGVAFQKAFIKGATSLGCDVVDVGEIATEMIYFATGSDLSFDGGATITASHNPPGWNGCKMVSKGASALSSDKGLPEIENLVMENEFEESEKPGTVTEENFYPAFKEKVLSFFEGTEIKPMKIVVDAGNGIGGKLFDYIFGDLNLDVTRMYFEPNGNFPNHIPNPIELENVHEIMAKTQELQADIGIAIDGDADRSFFVDNKGRNPDGVYIGSIFAEYFLKRNPGDTVILDPRVIGPVDDAVEKYGGTGVRCKAGHSFFKQKMKEVDAIFGSENSSHFFFRDFYHADSGMITIAIMLKLLSEGLDFDEKLDELYKKYPKSGEVNYEVNDVHSTIKKVEQYCRDKYENLAFDYIDGVSAEAKDWRFNLRPSNTQPLIRFNLEGKSKDKVIEKFREIEKVIGGKRDNMPVLKELQ